MRVQHYCAILKVLFTLWLGKLHCGILNFACMIFSASACIAVSDISIIKLCIYVLQSRALCCHLHCSRTNMDVDSQLECHESGTNFTKFKHAKLLTLSCLLILVLVPFNPLIIPDELLSFPCVLDNIKN